MISFEGRLIASSEPVSSGVRILRFGPVDEGELFPLHQSGQYALLEFPDFMPRPYSIANAPNGHTLEFHIKAGHSGAGAHATSRLKIGDVVPIHGYGGGGCLYKPDCSHPLLLVAGGTGLAPLLAIAQSALSDAPERAVSLFHGGRRIEDLYAHDLLRGMGKSIPSFSYHPVLSEVTVEGIAHGLVGDLAFNRPDDFSLMRVYCSGPVEMMRYTHDIAKAKGVPADFIHSDLTEFPSGSKDTDQ